MKKHKFLVLFFSALLFSQTVWAEGGESWYFQFTYRFVMTPTYSPSIKENLSILQTSDHKYTAYDLGFYQEFGNIYLGGGLSTWSDVYTIITNPLLIFK